MDEPASSENPYAAPAEDAAAVDRASNNLPLSKLAVGMWLGGMGLCGGIYAADRLLPVRLPEPALPLLFIAGICVSTVGAVRTGRSCLLTLSFIIVSFIGIVFELLVVSVIEMVLKGIGRFG
jgi:hypothetical protein